MYSSDPADEDIDYVIALILTCVVNKVKSAVELQSIHFYDQTTFRYMVPMVL